MIPILALLPLLAVTHGGAAAEHGGEGADGHAGASLIEGLPGWAQALVVLGAVVAIIAAGRFLVNPVFRVIARTRLRELFTASALLLVIGVSLLMSLVGMSAALGTFLAGVVLANSEFRHELEADIEPFKGLLLGLFFITVGAGIDFGLLMAQPGLIALLLVGLLTAKAVVLFALGWAVQRVAWVLRWREQSASQLKSAMAPPAVAGGARVWLGIVLVLAYGFAMPWLGFALTTLAYIVLWLLLGGIRKPLQIMLISLIGTLVFLYFFVKVALMPLDRGIGAIGEFSVALYRLLGIY